MNAVALILAFGAVLAVVDGNLFTGLLLAVVAAEAAQKNKSTLKRI